MRWHAPACVINLCDDDSESTAQLSFLFDLPAEVLENILVLLVRLDKKAPREIALQLGKLIVA